MVSYVIIKKLPQKLVQFELHTSTHAATQVLIHPPEQIFPHVVQLLELYVPAEPQPPEQDISHAS